MLDHYRNLCDLIGLNLLGSIVLSPLVALAAIGIWILENAFVKPEHRIKYKRDKN